MLGNSTSTFIWIYLYQISLYLYSFVWYARTIFFDVGTYISTKYWKSYCAFKILECDVQESIAYLFEHKVTHTNILNLFLILEYETFCFASRKLIKLLEMAFIMLKWLNSSTDQEMFIFDTAFSYFNDFAHHLKRLLLITFSH